MQVKKASLYDYNVLVILAPFLPELAHLGWPKIFQNVGFRDTIIYLKTASETDV